jgi:hypothetical protein
VLLVMLVPSSETIPKFPFPINCTLYLLPTVNINHNAEFESGSESSSLDFES